MFRAGPSLARTLTLSPNLPHFDKVDYPNNDIVGIEKRYLTNSNQILLDDIQLINGGCEEDLSYVVLDHRRGMTIRVSLVGSLPFPLERYYELQNPSGRLEGDGWKVGKSMVVLPTQLINTIHHPSILVEVVSFGVQIRQDGIITSLRRDHQRNNHQKGLDVEDGRHDGEDNDHAPIVGHPQHHLPSRQG